MTLKLAKVKFNAPLIESFFQENPEKSFGVTKGLPKDARLVGFYYYPDIGEGYAIFHSEQFDEIQPGETIPVKDIEYTAYRFTRETEEQINEPG